MKPNVVTQAVDALVAHGYATREAGTTDGRTRFLAVTDDGAEHVAAVNQSLVESLYATFPTQDPTYRTILEAAVAAAAHIEPPLHAGRAQRFPATRSLVSIELIRAETERTLRDATGASLNECRIVQRLGETDHPERVGTLAEQLMMSPVNAARAVDRLVGRGWAKRLKSPHDKKAVYVALTDEGVYQGFLISATVNELAATKLWVAPDSRAEGRHRARGPCGGGRPERSAASKGAGRIRPAPGNLVRAFRRFFRVVRLELLEGEYQMPMF